MMRALERYWLSPVAAIRPWLLFRATLLLFGLDVFADHLGAAWRYGTAGFNVPHFSFLDVLPMPTTEAYTGTLVAIGLSSFVCALSPRAPRWLVAAIAVAYLWSWASSMHDSYQHHYLLSLFLLAFACFPTLSARILFGTPGELVHLPFSEGAAEGGAATPSRRPRLDKSAGDGRPVRTATMARTATRARRKTRARAGDEPSLAGALLAGQTEGLVGLGLLAGACTLWGWRFFAHHESVSTAFDALWLGMLAVGIVLSARGSVLSARTGALDAALPHGLVPRASAWGLVVVWTTAAVVYTYTAISKMEPEWITGEALRNITRDGAAVPTFIELAASVGLEGERLWRTLGHSVVVLQVCCALGYATAPLRELASDPMNGFGRKLRMALDGLASIALVLALSFHLGAESMGLEIGWFSWYMIILAVVTFAPARWLSYVCFYATWPIRSLSERTREEPSPALCGLLALGAAVILYGVGQRVDLPGALAGCIVVAIGVMVGSIGVIMRSRGASEMRAAAIASVVGAIALDVSMNTTTVRYDYWRFAGGDFRRRGEWALALEAYERAERYAPEGRSRAHHIRELRERIASEGPRRRDD
jgi:hypothetical protein